MASDLNKQAVHSMLQLDHAELEWYMKHLEEKRWTEGGGGAPAIWKWKGEASVSGGSEAGWKDGSSPSSFTKAAGDVDKLLGGLLFGEPEPPPPPHLVVKLRRYAALHKPRGPGSELFEEAIRHLNSSSANLIDGDPVRSTDFSYVVWVPSDGLGNRIIALVSTFHHALLNDKVLLLLLRLSDDLRGLFWEPFPSTSWALSQDFPVGDLEIVYKNPPWLLLRGLSAAAPELPVAGAEIEPVLRPCSVYDKELNLMFPEATVFYHLGRYLLRPTNSEFSLGLHLFQSKSSSNPRLFMARRATSGGDRRGGHEFE